MIDIVTHEMIIRLEMIIVGMVDEVDEVEVMIILVAVDVVVGVLVIITIHVNRINHVLVLIIINRHGMIVVKADVEVTEVAFMIASET